MVGCVCLSVLGRVAEILDLKTSMEQDFLSSDHKETLHAHFKFWGGFNHHLK